MAEYFSAHWGGSNGLTSASRQAQLRSLSPIAKSPASPNKLTKSTSTPHLGKMTMVVTSPSPLSSFHPDSDLNTIPDPRTPSPALPISRHDSTGSRASQHPDLSNEVAALSTKLINSINTQTRLDDSLQESRHELEAAKQRLKVLEAAEKEHTEAIENGLLVSRQDFDKMEARLRKEAADERLLKGAVEKEKRRIESELENLTTALFTEANEMVADARKKTEDSEKRNDSLKQQLSDMEILLKSHQEQLQDLKAVMQQMSSEGETETNTHISTAPSTPGVAPQDKMSRIFEAANLTPNTPGSDDIPPDHPLRFSHLIHPVLRADTVAYREFQDMLRTARPSAPSSRVASGNFGGLNVMGLGSLTQNGSTTSLPSAANSPSLGTITSTPRDHVPSTPLKDAKFYKRAVAEDIEPTLRLDVAPGISWLARRTVLASMTAGSLVVEPHPPIPRFRGPVFPCALCGENRNAEEYARRFRFRTSEQEDAQRYPLCEYCLTRVRTSCDYIGFLRMVQNGHWRAETEEEKRCAWEESAKLRERMFWARLGGGVVPSFVPLRDSPRSPSYGVNGKGSTGVDRKSEESGVGLVAAAVDGADANGGLKPSPKELDPFRGDGEKGKRVSIGNTVLEEKDTGMGGPVGGAKGDADAEEAKIEREAEAQLHLEVRKSLQRVDLNETELEPEKETAIELAHEPVQVPAQDSPKVVRKGWQSVDLSQKGQNGNLQQSSQDGIRKTRKGWQSVDLSKKGTPDVRKSMLLPRVALPEQGQEQETPQDSVRDVANVASRSPSPRRKDERLSITIPGAFE